MENSLNIKVSTASLLKYALPTILSNLFMNIYSIVDQLFVSNLLGTDALSAVSIAWPLLSITLAVGVMISTGGCALVSNQMGAGDNEKARENFSFFTLFSVVVSAVFCVAGIIFREPILYAMGADDALYPLCEAYAIPIFMLIPFGMVSMVLQMFFVAAGKPGLGFWLSIAGGVTNMVLDYVLIAVIPLGIAGAAYASAAGYILQSVIAVVFFFTNRRGTLYFVRPRFNGKALLKACSNGMSEMVGMLAVTVTMIAMNVILMRLVGSDGVAAAAVILSAQTILSASYGGYIYGISPVVSYHYGAANYDELRKLYRVALKTIAVMSVITFILAFPMAKPIARLFANSSAAVTEMSVRGGISADGLQSLRLRFFHRAEQRQDLRHPLPVQNSYLPYDPAADSAGAAWRRRRVALHAGRRGAEHPALGILFPPFQGQVPLRVRRPTWILFRIS